MMTTKRLAMESLERRELFAGLEGFVGPLALPEPAEEGTLQQATVEIDSDIGSEVKASVFTRHTKEDIGCQASVISHASVIYDANSKVLDIEGTEYSDHVNLSRLGDDIRVEVSTGDQVALTRVYALGDVAEVVFHGNGCSDTFSNSTDIVSSVWGGDGDDVLTGGDGNDTIQGGKGADTIAGNGGRDQLDGEEGSDFIQGGRGNDSILGGGGGDVLRGGKGNDTIDGGDQDDSLHGDDGDDLLSGGDGSDTLQGGDGNDRLFGGVGEEDTLTSGKGADRYLVPLLPNGLGVQLEDDVTGFAIEKDAVVYFADTLSVQTQSFYGQDVEYSAGAWQDTEVLKVDAGLKHLFDRVESNVLLANPDGSPITMHRAGIGFKLHPFTGARYDEAGYTAWSSHDGSITFSQAVFDTDNDGIIDVPDNQIQGTVFHEIAHKWRFDDNPVWDDFLAPSGWTQSWALATLQVPFMGPVVTSGDGQWYYNADAEFVESYSKTNPDEDWATTVAYSMAAFAEVEYEGADQDAATLADLASKLNVVDDFFANLM